MFIKTIVLEQKYDTTDIRSVTVKLMKCTK